jgi:hypothetical protein
MWGIMMTFGTDNLRSLVYGPHAKREATIMTLVLWFCAGAFAAATLLSFADFESKILPFIAGVAVGLAATLVKFR